MCVSMNSADFLTYVVVVPIVKHVPFVARTLGKLRWVRIWQHEAMLLILFHTSIHSSIPCFG